MSDRLVAEASHGMSGRIAVPGDKSLSHRALIFAALAEGESRITGLSDGADVQSTAAALRALGSDIRRSGDTVIVRGGAWHAPAQALDCGNSGTTVRLLMGALAGRSVTATFTGDESLSRRPMRRVTEPLRAMGAHIEGGDRLPITVRGGSLRPIRHVSPVASAQVKSAILLAGLGAGGRTEVIEPLPSRDHSERLLPAFGATIERRDTAEGPLVSITGPQALTAAEIFVPGDISSAVFPLAAALLVPGSSVTVTGVGVNPLRTGLLDVLREMGAELTLSHRGDAGEEPVADLAARTSSLRAIAVPADYAPRMIDEYPLLAVLAARADGETAMHGLAELRHKESDRLAAVADGLAACGVRVRVEGDSLFVTGGAVRGGATIHSGGDHRIAMAFLILGLVSQAPIRVEGAEMIATSFSGFAELMRGLGARIGPA